MLRGRADTRRYPILRTSVCAHMCVLACACNGGARPPRIGEVVHGWTFPASGRGVSRLCISGTADLKHGTCAPNAYKDARCVFAFSRQRTEAIVARWDGTFWEP